MLDIKYVLEWSPIDSILVYDSLEAAVMAAVERGLLPCKITKNIRERKSVPYVAAWCIKIEKGTVK